MSKQASTWKKSKKPQPQLKDSQLPDEALDQVAGGRGSLTNMADAKKKAPVEIARNLRG